MLQHKPLLGPKCLHGGLPAAAPQGLYEAGARGQQVRGTPVRALETRVHQLQHCLYTAGSTRTGHGLLAHSTLRLLNNSIANFFGKMI